MNYFSKLNNEFRKIEFSNDRFIPKDKYVIMRLDGKGFSKFTKSLYEKPFDIKFHELMKNLTKHLFNQFPIKLAYFQSDEISILFKDELGYNRKERKYLSLCPSSISSFCSLKVNKPVMFDSRMIYLENKEQIKDYFKWRYLDSHRNCINAYCFWYLVLKKNYSERKAEKELNGKTKAWKLDFLRNEFGLDYKTIEKWKAFGTCLYEEKIKKEGFNPKTNEKTLVERNVLKEFDEMENLENWLKFLKGKYKI